MGETVAGLLRKCSLAIARGDKSSALEAFLKIGEVFRNSPFFSEKDPQNLLEKRVAELLVSKVVALGRAIQKLWQTEEVEGIVSFASVQYGIGDRVVLFEGTKEVEDAVREAKKLGNTEIAVALSELLLKWDFSNPVAVSVISQKLLSAGQVGKALDLVRKALSVRPTNPDLLEVLGDTLTHAGRVAEAVRSYLKASLLSYREEGERESARKKAFELITRYGDDAMLNYLRREFSKVNENDIYLHPYLMYNVASALASLGDKVLSRKIFELIADDDRLPDMLRTKAVEKLKHIES